MSAAKIEREAADWLARLESAPSAELLASFRDWCDESPRHEAAYARLAATWARLDRLRALAPADSSEREAPASTGAAAATSIPLTQSGPPTPERRRGTLVRLAAVLAAAGLIGLIWLAGHRETGLYQTDVGDFRRIALDDGSTVELNTDTRLVVRFTPKHRLITLDKGEANFIVAHDAARPFSVIAGDTAVRATGTRFAVRRAADVEVVVSEGTVAILSPERDSDVSSALEASTPLLRAGHAAKVDRARVRPQSLSEQDLDRRMAWQRGMLVFDVDSIDEIAREFNRYSKRKLVVTDPEVGRLEIGGYFKATNVAEFVDVLEHNYGVRVVRDDDQILLTGFDPGRARK